MDMFHLIIFIICLAIIYFYYKVKNYDSLGGILLISFGVFLLIAKLIYDKTPFHVLFSANQELALLYTALYTVFAIVFLSLKNRRLSSKSVRYSFILLFLYIPFGILQQLLFQYIFLDSVYKLTGSIAISLILGPIYYMAFHLRKPIDKFAYETLLVGIGWSYLYLAFGNVLWLGVSHGILGMYYYANYFSGDPLSKRLKGTYLLIKKIL